VICERVVDTRRRECLDRMVIFGPRQLQGVLDEYLAHYNGHRTHRSLSQRPPAGSPLGQVRHPDGSGMRHDVLGGLIDEYQPAA
jgi:hypothetical protein